MLFGRVLDMGLSPYSAFSTYKYDFLNKNSTTHIYLNYSLDFNTATVISRICDVVVCIFSLWGS